MPLTRDQRTIKEATTAQYMATLTDEAGVAIPSADLTTLTLTLYNESTAAIINSRDAQSVLNANGGTMHATSGLLTMIFAVADNPIVDTSLTHGQTETHIAMFKFTWNAGAKAGYHLVTLEAEQLLKVV